VIKYVPAVGDSKRALDEYTSRIFMGGLNTIAMHNTCEDSLLAAPLMIDLVVVAEMCERITLRRKDAPAAESEGFHAVLSFLSYMLKAPLVPSGTPVINALFKQREALVNVFRACVGLPPENHLLLEHRLPTAGTTTLPCIESVSAGMRGYGVPSAGDLLAAKAAVARSAAGAEGGASGGCGCGTPTPDAVLEDECKA